eukprot:Em0021g958a
MSTLSNYKDHKLGCSAEEYDQKLLLSSTLYVGNLSFYTTEDQMYELFSMCGEVKRVIMGSIRTKRRHVGSALWSSALTKRQTMLSSTSVEPS